jgi:hypothetical protein
MKIIPVMMNHNYLQQLNLPNNQYSIVYRNFCGYFQLGTDETKHIPQNSLSTGGEK